MAFHGKVALVTGAASGMGRIAAQRLAKQGATVAAVDLNEAGLEETAKGFDTIRRYSCDVSDLEAVRSLFARVEGELGTIDRVTHAAAIMPTCLLAKATPDWVERLMRVNYDGTVNVALTAVGPMFARRSGDLILFGSVAGYVMTPHMGAYCATKAAVNAFGELLIRENEGSGVRILLVCPPMVNTPLLKQALDTSNPRSLQQGISQGRLADPEVIVDEIEKGIESGKTILFPGEAKMLWRMRRFVPNLLWRLIRKSEGI